MSTETEVFLAHYGVKGMRWGVRRAKTEGDIRRAEDRARIKRANKTKYSNDDIRGARARQAKRARIYIAAQKAATKRDPRSGRLYLAKSIVKEQKNWVDQEDAYIAARRTTGEKAIAGLLGGPVGLALASDARTHIRVGNAMPERDVRRDPKG